MSDAHDRYDFAVLDLVEQTLTAGRRGSIDAYEVARSHGIDVDDRAEFHQFLASLGAFSATALSMWANALDATPADMLALLRQVGS